MRRVAPRFRVGTVVRVNGSVPLDKGRLAHVVDRREVKTNGRGIALLPGHYQPLRRDDVTLRDIDTGELLTAHVGCLDPVI
jgi:hypothetical protein